MQSSLSILSLQLLYNACLQAEAESNESETDVDDMGTMYSSDPAISP